MPEPVIVQRDEDSVSTLVNGQRLLIVEEALCSRNAHWFEYIQTISDAAVGLGASVDVACNAGVDEEIKQALETFPIFQHARYLANSKRRLPGERFYGWLLHNFRTWRALRKFLKQRETYDHAIAPTVLIHHLLAWWLIMRFSRRAPKQLTLLFVTNPGIWDLETKSASIPRSAGLQGKLLKLFRGQVQAGKVVMAAETKGAKKEFETLSGLQFALFPHAVPSEKINRGPNGRVARPFVFASYGFARYEKGSDILKEAICQFLEMYPKEDVLFRVQWLSPFALPDQTSCGPEELRSYDKVEIIDRSLDSVAYRQLFETTDCMLLPYRNTSYHARLSRLAVEAACAGIPMIYPADGWLDEHVAEYGMGVRLPELTADALSVAMKQQLEGGSNTESNDTACDYFSGENFVRQWVSVPT